MSENYVNISGSGLQGEQGSQFNPQLKVFQHPDRVAEFLKKGYTSAPVSIEISPANYCNAQCNWCFYAETQDKSGIEQGLMLRTIDELAEMGVQSINWTGGGEPTLHPNFREFVERSYEKKVLQGIFTNALKYMRADPKKFEWIRVSIVPKPDVIPYENIERYAREAKEVGVCYSLEARDLTRLKNGETLEDIVKHLRDTGVTYLQLRPVLPVGGGVEHHPIEPPEEMKKYSNDKFKVHITSYKFENFKKERRYPVCYGHNFTPFIWENGDVAVCAYHYKQDNWTFGNLHDKTFKEIWAGERRQEVIKSELVKPSCQTCCKLDELNILLYAIKDSKPRHPQFL